MSSDDFTRSETMFPEARAAGRLAWMRDGIAARIAERVLARAPRGRLRLSFPSGRGVVVGSPDTGPSADLALANFGVITKSARWGAIGFAESWMDGDCDTTSLIDFLRWFMDNEAAFGAVGRGIMATRRRDRAYHGGRANTRDGSRRNIAAHYDLGNAFYKLWLDEGLAYSSALFTRPDMTLVEAQAAKNARIIEALGVAPGDRLLEIGCGWGGFAEAAARAGADVTAITISREQFAEATARLGRAGLSDRAQVVFQDYRDTEGRFDKLASVEMIEAVGEENWRRYFTTLSARLRPGGVGVLQAITIDEAIYPTYARNPDFIQRYIFPGGMLPTIELMREHAEAAGLRFEVVERFGASYARTLEIWRETFMAAWPRIAALGFDERFRRMWEYYLAYCEVGFERGIIDVGLYRLTKPTGSA